MAYPGQLLHTCAAGEERGQSSFTKACHNTDHAISQQQSLPCTRVPEETALNDYYTYTDLLLFAISSGPHGHRTCTMPDCRAHVGGGGGGGSPQQPLLL